MSTTAQAWRVIATGGGRWTVAEVRASLLNENADTVENVVRVMANTGYLQFYDKNEEIRKFRFGVTATCKVPRGITNWEVVEAMGMQLLPGVEEAALPQGMKVAEVLRTMAVPQRKAA